MRSARDRQTADWSFAQRPFWLFSHVFAATVVISFVLLGVWQLSRHGERAERNELVAARSEPPAAELVAVLGEDPAEVDHVLVAGRGTYLDGDLVRVANRSQNGIAGQHVVGLLGLDDGSLVLVNRGFVPLIDADEARPAPTGQIEVSGWLRQSVTRGWIGATDTGEGEIIPRLDVAAVGLRLDASPAGDLAPLWLQLDASGDGAGVDPSSWPQPVPLAPLDPGPHLGYMAQWFIFATLGVLFYGALLWRTATGRNRRIEPVVDDPGELVGGQR